MLNDAKAKKFDRILFIKLDRFFRSVAEYHECMKYIDPVIWTATEEKYDLATANGRAFVNMKLTIAELEAELKELEAKLEPAKERDLTMYKDLLSSGWKDLYNALTDENKQAFWRKYIKEIEVNKDGTINRVIFF